VQAAPAVLRRAQWGAQESLRPGPIDYDEVVEKIVLHHTAIDDGSGDWVRQVRDIYVSETGAGYRDIAYHFLVDPNGAIYEGRWAREYPHDMTPDGEDAAGRSVRGGHARGHNPRTLGIAVLGDYTSSEPSGAALGALVELLVWKCGRWGIDPMASSPYVNTRSETESFPDIAAHGQIRATQCPGRRFEALLPDLRAEVAQRLGAQ
jgi:N-acetylmuramoyl-L-alanine amidase